MPTLQCPPPNAGKDARAAFERDLLRLGAYLRAKSRAANIILLCDGAEHLISGASPDHAALPRFPDVLAAIRRISQEAGFLASLLVLTSPATRRSDRVNSQNPLALQAEQKLFLASLSEEGCNCLINGLGAQMGLTYAEEALSRLYYETGGHPYVTRQVCSLIVKNRQRAHAQPWRQTPPEQPSIEVRDVEQAVAEYLAYKSDYFESLWQQFERSAREIMRLMATKHSCTLADLLNAAEHPQARPERTQAVAVLNENDLIERCENKYSIKMGLFERFILAKN